MPHAKGAKDALAACPVNALRRWFPLCLAIARWHLVSRGFCRRRQTPSDHRGIDCGDRLLVPEGHRRKLAGGKNAPAGAAPGCRAERAMPRRGIEEISRAVGHAASLQPFGGSRPAGDQFPEPSTAIGPQNCRPISSMPRWGTGATPQGGRGLRPLPRTCPRLISAGVPPGRKTCLPSHQAKAGAIGAGILFQMFLVAAPPRCGLCALCVRQPVSLYRPLTYPPRYALFTCGLFRNAAAPSCKMMRPVSST